MNIEELKKEFVQNEIITLSINGAFGRGNVYRKKFPEEKEKDYEKKKEDFRKDIRKKLKEIKNKDYDDTTNIILDFRDKVIKNWKYKNILLDNHFRIGTAQKLINLYLKYLWVLGWGNEPFHCPVDSIINGVLNGNYNFTQSDSEAEYKKIIDLATKKAKEDGLSIATWELKEWQQKISAESGLTN